MPWAGHIPAQLFSERGTVTFTLEMTRMATPGQIDEFNLRVKRIKDPRNVSYYDAEMKMNVPKRVSKDYINRKKIKKVGLLALVFSAVLGVLAYSVVQIASDRFGILPAGSELVMFGVAAILVLIFGGMCSHKTMSHMSAQVMGVGIMMASAHNAVWMFPDTMSQVVSARYVQDVRANTAPNSIIVLGVTYSN